MPKRDTFDDDRLMKPNEVAEKVGVCRRTLYSWANAGLIPSVKIARGSRRFVRSEIEAWVQKAQQESDRRLSANK